MLGGNLEHVETQVLIIGAGAAGLRAAIELAENDISCLIVGKRQHGDAHTVMAAGGINAALGSLDPEDTWAIHAADTLKEGHFVCDTTAVELLSQKAPERVRELNEWGCDFNFTEDGEINQRYFGAQSFRRTCFVGDRTGEAILHTLVKRAKELGIPYRENLFITRILVDDGRAVGAFAVDLDQRRPVACHSNALVLAAGGYTSCYLRGSSRNDENTGDAALLAYQAGCTLQDMEFVQFHPTGMVAPSEMKGRLVTEAVRGEGGHLLNTEGERFMERYSPEAMELDARDVVARAIWQEIQEGRGTEQGGLLLDISHKDDGFIRERLPKMVDRFANFGVDITKEPMEVAPTAHYAMGGVRVDFETGETGVPGLYAVGEATAGVHGANRLGGNSLAETVVFGQITGAAVGKALDQSRSPEIADTLLQQATAEIEQLYNSDGNHQPQRLSAELRKILWNHAGISRHQDSLRDGQKALEALKDEATSLAIKNQEDLVGALDLRAMMLVADCILKGALFRKESRGAHYREDYPEEQENHAHNILYYSPADGEITLKTKEPGTIHPDVEKALEADYHMDYHHLE